MDKIKKLGITPLWVVLLIIPFLWGGFYDFSVCVVDIVLIIILLIKYIKNKSIKIEFNYSFYIALVLLVGNFFTLFYGIDKIDCLFGLLRSIALFMFVLNLNQLEEGDRNKLKLAIPFSGIVMIIVSALLAIIPFTRSFVVTDGKRFAGFFQYANAFAIFLLMGFNIILNSNISNKIKIQFSLLFIVSILFTGSRITFVLLVLNLIFFTFKSEKKDRIKFVAGFIIVIIVSLIFALVTNNFQNIGRIFTISLSSSSLLGRLVYYKDGLAILIKNIFGHGYMGYSYVYPEFQTAPYYIKFIHNDYLQIALDIGIIPAILFIGIFVKSFFDKSISFNNKILLLTLGIHMFFEFDFEFFSILCIFMLLIYTDKKSKDISFSFMIVIFEVILVLWNGYFGFANASNILGKGELASNLISDYTEAKEKKTLECYENDNIKEAGKLADEILSNNKYSIIGYNVKAYYDCSARLYDDMIIQKQNAISLNKYNMEMYDDYILLLSRAIEDSINSQNYENANKYIGYALGVEEMLTNLKNNTSNLSYSFIDSPTFELSDSSMKYLEVLKQNK